MTSILAIPHYTEQDEYAMQSYTSRNWEKTEGLKMFCNKELNLIYKIWQKI